MRLLLLSFFLLVLVSLGLLYGLTEGFAATASAAATNKKQWTSMRANWLPAYVLNRATATPAQHQFYTLLMGDPQSLRIDKLSKAPKNLTMQQQRNIYDVEIKNMITDIEEWSSEGFRSKAHMITQAVDGRWEDATRQEWVPRGHPEDRYNCAYNPDYIKKDEIPCWNCTL